MPDLGTFSIEARIFQSDRCLRRRLLQHLWGFPFYPFSRSRCARALKEKPPNPLQSHLSDSHDGRIAGSADTMKSEKPLMRFNSPIAVFGGCYSNLEATVALLFNTSIDLAYLQAIASAQVISSRTEPMPKRVSN